MLPDSRYGRIVVVAVDDMQLNYISLMVLYIHIRGLYKSVYVYIQSKR